ncbi:MarR family winged helix-turn-helix transcriptional regulator [Aurantimonas sp. 22II-16-19i]|uniref:MarR family winged helix-turn-helix transcriptional regulator n=1 Tax=Aurantimonas sp. 22II-16-19i TaxID=1317114 RepID=UPI0009F7B1D9|nr:MarR family winged helix-turn-helix transcriptional regulator [Aurantimonas sp. 22II-16-19i]ORE94761.1 MarR family transcriptional regulator [Aurantimonas sp. 22II-16-19i]
MLTHSPPVIVPSLLSISKSTRAFLTLLLVEIELHPGQDQLLDRLDMENPVDVSTLADLLAVRPSTVSKMLDRLIERGLVSRSANARDARRTMVHLTPEGLEAQRKVRDLWNKLEADLTSALSQDEIALLDDSLYRAGDILSQKLRRLR